MKLNQIAVTGAVAAIIALRAEKAHARTTVGIGPATIYNGGLGRIPQFAKGNSCGMEVHQTSSLSTARLPNRRRDGLRFDDFPCERRGTRRGGHQHDDRFSFPSPDALLRGAPRRYRAGTAIFQLHAHCQRFVHRLLDAIGGVRKSRRLPIRCRQQWSRLDGGLHRGSAPDRGIGVEPDVCKGWIG